MKANFAAFANALCHLNATPLSVAVLAPCAWSGNLATRQIQLGKCVKMGAVWAGDFSLSLSLSLSLVSFLFAIYFVNFLNLFCSFCHFEPLQKGEKSKGLKVHLLFLDTSLTLSMTNSGFCLKIMDIFTQILKQKFKFFTQISKHFVNSKHCINSTHFIFLSQISSLTQGFFIFLPQVFAQCKLINFNTRRKNGR